MKTSPSMTWAAGETAFEVGEPIGIFYGYNCLGVDPTTGNLVYEDINGDGVADCGRPDQDR